MFKPSDGRYLNSMRWACSVSRWRRPFISPQIQRCREMYLGKLRSGAGGFQLLCRPRAAVESSVSRQVRPEGSLQSGTARGDSSRSERRIEPASTAIVYNELISKVPDGGVPWERLIPMNDRFDATRGAKNKLHALISPVPSRKLVDEPVTGTTGGRFAISVVRYQYRYMKDCRLFR
jgi:hypothetical protein